ncbi:uncharacterized protein TNCV_400631 [Trichonephila clavipes]|nr:uncharacterized protein TNCV_400631 [Trichonephila clavipes]
MLMAELTQEHEKFDLSYFDNVVVFSEGWDFSIDHMDGILELNTHLAVRPGEFELVQDGVEYCSHVVGLGKQSPAQLKDMRRTGFEGPDWRQKAKMRSASLYLPLSTYLRQFSEENENHLKESHERENDVKKTIPMYGNKRQTIAPRLKSPTSNQPKAKLNISEFYETILEHLLPIITRRHH